VKLTTHLHLVPKFRISGVTYICTPQRDSIACTGMTSLYSPKFRKLCSNWTNSISHLKHARTFGGYSAYFDVGGACLLHFLAPCFTASSAALQYFLSELCDITHSEGGQECASAVAASYRNRVPRTYVSLRFLNRAL
jgi:hypothetical protein